MNSLLDRMAGALRKWSAANFKADYMDAEALSDQLLAEYDRRADGVQEGGAAFEVLVNGILSRAIAWHHGDINTMTFSLGVRDELKRALAAPSPDAQPKGASDAGGRNVDRRRLISALQSFVDRAPRIIETCRIGEGIDGDIDSVRDAIQQLRSDNDRDAYAAADRATTGASLGEFTMQDGQLTGSTIKPGLTGRFTIVPTTGARAVSDEVALAKPDHWKLREWAGMFSDQGFVDAADDMTAAADFIESIGYCENCGGSGWHTEHGRDGVPCGDSPCETCNPNGDAEREAEKTLTPQPTVQEATAPPEGTRAGEDGAIAALEHIAMNLSLSVPLGCDESSHYRGQLCEAIGTAARALERARAPVSRSGGAAPLYSMDSLKAFTTSALREELDSRSGDAGGDRSLPYEQALSELIDKLIPGIDAGDILADAKAASARIDLMLQAKGGI